MKIIFLLFVCLTISVVSFGQDKPTPLVKSKMTNADVIQLVTAGLSEQVVIVSIRQASERDFDLTPTSLIALKKAGVSDAVILVMQNVDVPVKPADPNADNVPKDDTISGIKDYLQKRVTTESAGAITLSSFSRVNGYEQELTKMYVLEWQAEILFQQQGWKLGDFFVGFWQDFQVFPQKPGGGLDNLLLAASGKGDAKHFNKGTKIRLTGDCVLRKTEQGWRTENFTVKTSQVIAEGGPTEPTPKAPASATSVEKLQPGSSLEVTKAWLEANIPRLGSFSVVVTGNAAGSKPLNYEYENQGAVLSDGRLTVRRTEIVGGDEDLRWTYTETVTLKDADLSKIRADAMTTTTSKTFTYSKPIYRVSLYAAAGRGAPFTSQIKRGGNPANAVRSFTFFTVYARDEEAANLVADALRQAAVLCGAPSQPAGTVGAEPTQKAKDPSVPGQLTAEQIQNIVTKSTAGQFASPLAEKTLSEFLVAESSKTGVPLWFVLAQAKRETSFGSPQNGTVQDGRTFEDGTKGNAHNLFNIRPGSSWTGKKLDLGPGSGEFRVYDSYQDSVSDYMRLMSSNTYKGLTLRAIVYKYFPPSDNGGSAATESYIDSIINFVASQGATITRDTVVVGSSTNSFPEIM